jgi:hypothetical protein
MFLEESLGILRKFDDALSSDTSNVQSGENANFSLSVVQGDNRHQRPKSFTSDTLPELIRASMDRLCPFLLMSTTSGPYMNRLMSKEPSRFCKFNSRTIYD